jgi:hypothetical protein
MPQIQQQCCRAEPTEASSADEQRTLPTDKTRPILTYLRYRDFFAAGKPTLIPNNERDYGDFIAAAYLTERFNQRDQAA